MRLTTPTLLFLLLSLVNLTAQSTTAVSAPQYETPLPIPPILENSSRKPGEVRLSLSAQKGRKELLPGKPTDTMGFNGNWLGPTIRVRRGDSVQIAVANRLGEDTTVHWHGLHVPGEMDGGPRQVIPAGK